MTAPNPRGADNPNGVEVRWYPTSGLQFRDTGASDDSPTVEVSGFCIRYGADAIYQVYDGLGDTGYFEEQMHPGVADSVIRSNNDGRGVAMLINHNQAMLPLSRTPQTMRLEETPQGVRFTAQIDTRMTDGANLAVALSKGLVNTMSVGMSVKRDAWDSGFTKRDVFELGSLPEISAVTNAASPTTSIGISPRSVLLAGQTSPRAGRGAATGESRKDQQRARLRADIARIQGDRAARGSRPVVRQQYVPFDVDRAAEIERLERAAQTARTFGDMANFAVFRARLQALREEKGQ